MQARLRGCDRGHYPPPFKQGFTDRHDSQLDMRARSGFEANGSTRQDGCCMKKNNLLWFHKTISIYFSSPFFHLRPWDWETYNTLSTFTLQLLLLSVNRGSWKKDCWQNGTKFHIQTKIPRTDKWHQNRSSIEIEGLITIEWAVRWLLYTNGHPD